MRRAPGDDAVQRRAEPIDVGAPVERHDAADRLLGRHERGRAGDRVRARRVALELARQAEVHDVGVLAAVAALFDHDVRRLQVAVDEAEPVRRVNGIGDVVHDRDLLLQRQRRRGARQRAPVDELHADVRAAGDLADLVHLADVRVLDARLRTRFVQKARHLLRILGREHLDGDVASEARVVGAIDAAGSAGAEERLDLIALVAGERLLQPNLARIDGAGSERVGGVCRDRL